MGPQGWWRETHTNHTKHGPRDKPLSHHRPQCPQRRRHVSLFWLQSTVLKLIQGFSASQDSGSAANQASCLVNLFLHGEPVSPHPTGSLTPDFPVQGPLQTSEGVLAPFPLEVTHLTDLHILAAQKPSPGGRLPAERCLWLCPQTLRCRKPHILHKDSARAAQ